MTVARWLGLWGLGLSWGLVATGAHGGGDGFWVPFDPPVPAPALSLANLDGQRRSLDTWRGRYVLLNFWATWCPPCIAEMPSLERLQQRLPEEKLRVVAVAQDAGGRDVVAPFVARLSPSLAVLLDPDATAGDHYGVHELPATFLLDPQGRVIAAAKGARTWDAPAALERLEPLVMP
ncbi:MAG: TlpA disulfide reductase family protein [Candidatus Competibacterales bacterium]